MTIPTSLFEFQVTSFHFTSWSRAHSLTITRPNQPSDVEVVIKVPDGTKGRDLAVTIKTRALSAKLKSGKLGDIT